MRILFLALIVGLTAPASSWAEPRFVIIEGLGGAPEYSERFASEAGRVAAAARRSAAGERQRRLLRGPTRDWTTW